MTEAKKQPQKDSPRPPNNDIIGGELEARTKKLRHKIKEARRLVNQRFDELEAEVERLKIEQAG